MTFQLYHQVVLVCDVPEAQLLTGDVAVLVDWVSHPADGEQGAVLEVFNALGESLDVVIVPVSAIASLGADQMPTVRRRAS